MSQKHKVDGNQHGNGNDDVHVTGARMKHEKMMLLLLRKEMSTPGRLLRQSGRPAGKYQEELSMLQAVPYDSWYRRTNVFVSAAQKPEFTLDYECKKKM